MAMSVMFKYLDVDLQKAVVGESVQGGAWRPLVTGLGWTEGMIEPSDWANPRGV